MRYTQVNPNNHINKKKYYKAPKETKKDVIIIIIIIIIILKNMAKSLIKILLTSNHIYIKTKINNLFNNKAMDHL